MNKKYLYLIKSFMDNEYKILDSINSIKGTIFTCSSSYKLNFVACKKNEVKKALKEMKYKESDFKNKKIIIDNYTKNYKQIYNTLMNLKSCEEIPATLYKSDNGSSLYFIRDVVLESVKNAIIKDDYILIAAMESLHGDGLLCNVHINTTEDEIKEYLKTETYIFVNGYPKKASFCKIFKIPVEVATEFVANEENKKEKEIYLAKTIDSSVCKDIFRNDPEIVVLRLEDKLNDKEIDNLYNLLTKGYIIKIFTTKTNFTNLLKTLNSKYKDFENISNNLIFEKG